MQRFVNVSTDKADAKAYTYADGFTVTNQTLADDGALVAFMEGRIRFHVMNTGFTWETQDREKDIAAARDTWRHAAALLADPDTEGGRKHRAVELLERIRATGRLGLTSPSTATA